MGRKSRKKKEARPSRTGGPQPKERKPWKGAPLGVSTKAKDLPIHFTKKNYIGFAIGILTIASGFLSLSQGSITLATILLVLGYCVIIPIAIILK